MRKRLFFSLTLLLFSGFIFLILRIFPFAAESAAHFLLIYVYPGMHGFFAQFPFSVGEALLIFLTLGGIWQWICALIRRRILRFLVCMLQIFSLLLAGYCVLWLPVSLVPVCTIPEYSTSSLYSLTTSLIQNASSLCCRSEPPQPDSTLKSAAALTGKAAKASLLPEWLQFLSLAGIYLPWTAEAVINPHEPAWSLPFMICHEIAHASGIASEAEANLAAYYFCLSGDAAFRYSGYLSILRYAMQELYIRDPDLWHLAIEMLLPPVYLDLASIGGFTQPVYPGLRPRIFSHSSYSDVLGLLIHEM